MNQFYEMKGIKREFSVARTPQQNGVAESKNMTLIEAARTMLADSKFPTTFWAEAVNTACIKPALSFIRPFGCPVTILNTNSKAFRVFNSRTRIVEENLHVQFSENTSNIPGSGPNWLFDIDALTNSINYKPVVARNQSNGNAGTKACDNAGEEEKMDTKYPGNENKASRKDSEVPSTEEPREDQRVNQELDASINSTNNINTASDGNNTNNVNVAVTEVNAVDLKTSIELPNDPNMPELEDVVYSDDDEDVGVEADMNNFDAFMPVSPIPTTRIHKDHLVEQIIKDLNSAPQTRRMTKNLKEHEEPKKVIRALKDPSWIEAMHDELLQFKLQKKGIRVNAGDSKLMLLGTNLLLLEKVNAARHNLLLLVNVNAVEGYRQRKTVNGEVQLQALVDKKKVIITESTIRRDLQLEDANGVDCLPSATIFEQLTLIAHEEMSKGSEIPTDPHHTPIIQPSTSQPQKKQSRRKQRKDTAIPQSSGTTEHIADEVTNKENVPTQSNDPPLSRTAQAKEIASLMKRVKKLERKRKSKTPRMKRLFKIGRSIQVVSSEDEGLGDQEDVSK
ncbi:ribonuclease H-like domain-containing protein [Tanacetum coccineum]